MRVVSQNGDIDVPYELTAFHACNGRIRMNMAGDTGRGTEVAVYRSKEKALEIMDEMRELYIRVHETEIYTYNSTYCCPVFRFPKENEVIT